MRNIKPELVAFIDDKIRNNGSAQYALREGGCPFVIYLCSGSLRRSDGKRS